MAKNTCHRPAGEVFAMLDAIVAAAPADIDAVWQLYADVCAHQDHDAYNPRWSLGVYPTRNELESHIAAGQLYVGLLENKVVAAMVLTSQEDPEYASVPWTYSAAGNDVAVIHLLCVHPQARGQQAGLALAREAVRLARAAGKLSIHLDVVPGNLAASRIYQAAGFVHVCNHEIFYEDTGAMDFEMYERVL